LRVFQGLLRDGFKVVWDFECWFGDWIQSFSWIEKWWKWGLLGVFAREEKRGMVGATVGKLLRAGGDEKWVVMLFRNGGERGWWGWESCVCFFFRFFFYVHFFFSSLTVHRAPIYIIIIFFFLFLLFSLSFPHLCHLYHLLFFSRVSCLEMRLYLCF